MLPYRIKRIYDPYDDNDGYRILVDRLWPRGISKEKASLDLWMKDIAPSSALRTWFHADPDRFEEFRLRYREELAHNPAVQELKKLAGTHRQVTLLYGSRDPQRNHALVLLEFLK